jgi:hypothetical protein
VPPVDALLKLRVDVHVIFEVVFDGNGEARGRGRPCGRRGEGAASGVQVPADMVCA